MEFIKKLIGIIDQKELVEEIEIVTLHKNIRDYIMMEEKKDAPSPNNQPPVTPSANANAVPCEDQRTSSRRSRKDEEGRDYLCGCGKRYLSYPALYTHIKTKHDGKQPEGTLKTGTNPITKRTKVKLEEETLKAIIAFFSDFELNTLTQLG